MGGDRPHFTPQLMCWNHRWKNWRINVRIWRVDWDGIISACWGCWRDRRVNVQPNLSANSWRTYWTWIRWPCLTEPTVLCLPNQRREKRFDPLLFWSISFMSGTRFCVRPVRPPMTTPTLSGKEALCLPQLYCHCFQEESCVWRSETGAAHLPWC